MRISYRHKFIYIHVPRTGGTSVSSALDPFSYRISTTERLLAAVMRRLSLPTDYYRWQKFSTQHVTTQQLRETFPSNVFNTFFKFAFVRNPWDWLVSNYFVMFQHPTHPQYELVRYLNDFGKYLEWKVENDRVLQRSFVVDDVGELLVDFVGRFENLSEDFETINQRIGINASLGTKNAAEKREHTDYRQYYNSHTQVLVQEAYREDIEYWNYSF